MVDGVLMLKGLLISVHCVYLGGLHYGRFIWLNICMACVALLQLHKNHHIYASVLRRYFCELGPLTDWKLTRADLGNSD
jgi:hypothetical protein